MTYIRKAGTFSKTDLGVTYKSAILNSTYHFWDDDSGAVHGLYLLYSSTTANLVHINHTTGDSYILTASGPNLGFNTFAFYNGYLYFTMSNGFDNYVYAYRYDGAGNLNHFYTFPTSGETCNIVTLGTDNKIYMGSAKGVAQVNTSTLDVTYIAGATHGLIRSGTSECNGIISDGTWLFAVFRAYGTANHYYATIYKLDGSDTSYVGDDESYTGGNDIIATTTGWQFGLATSSWFYWSITTASGSPPRGQTFDGTYSGPTAKGTTYSYYQYYRSTHYIVNQDYPTAHDGNLGAWNIDTITSSMAPWAGNSNTHYYYINHILSEDLIDIPLTFVDDITSYVYPYRLLPLDDHTLIIFPIAYNYKSTYNFISPAVEDYLGTDGISPYSILPKIGSNYYWLGYSGKIAVYDPTAPWTWAQTDTAGGNPYYADNTSSIIPQWPYYACIDANGLIWTGGGNRDAPTESLAYWNPADPDDAEKIYSAGFHCRSLGKSEDGESICVGNNDSTIWVYSATTKAYSKTINLASAVGFSGNVFLADIGTDSWTFAIVSDESTNYKLAKVDLTTDAVTVYNLPAGLPFGYTGSLWRIDNRFLKGPDGNYYFFGGTSSKHFYAVDSGGNFTDLGDMGDYYMPTFVDTYVVFSDPSDTHLYLIDMFNQPYSKGDYASLPADDTDLETLYTSDEVDDVATDDDLTYVDQVGDDGIAIHQFKGEVNAPGVMITWDGHSTIDCGDSAVYLQIYNRNTSTWDPVDFDNSTTAGNDFTLQGTVSPLDDYTDEDNIISCRVYQEEL